MERAVKTLSTLSERVGKALEALAAFCLIAIVTITVLNIIMRRPPFESPVMGAHELTSFLGALVIGLALPINQIRGGNIRVEMLLTWLPEAWQHALNRIVLFASGILCTAIAIQLFNYAWFIQERGEVSMTLAIPYHPFILAVSLSFAILAAVLFIQTIAPRSHEDAK